MKNSINKVDYYYNQLVDYANFAFSDKKISLLDKEVSIKTLLSKIIEENKESLLTKSYMYYLILDSICDFSIYKFTNYCERLCNKLEIILNNDDELIKDLITYFDVIERQDIYFARFSVDETKRIKYLLDENKQFMDELHSVLIILEANYDFYTDEDGYLILKNAFEIIASYCLINNKQDDFNLIMQDIFSDVNKFLEKINLNGEFVFDYKVNLDKLIICVLNILYNSKKLIK